MPSCREWVWNHRQAEAILHRNNRFDGSIITFYFRRSFLYFLFLWFLNLYGFIHLLPLFAAAGFFLNNFLHIQNHTSKSIFISLRINNPIFWFFFLNFRWMISARFFFSEKLLSPKILFLLHHFELCTHEGCFTKDVCHGRRSEINWEIYSKTCSQKVVSSSHVQVHIFYNDCLFFKRRYNPLDISLFIRRYSCTSRSLF